MTELLPRKHAGSSCPFRFPSLQGGSLSLSPPDPKRFTILQQHPITSPTPARPASVRTSALQGGKFSLPGAVRKGREKSKQGGSSSSCCQPAQVVAVVRRVTGAPASGPRAICPPVSESPWQGGRKEKREEGEEAKGAGVPGGAWPRGGGGDHRGALCSGGREEREHCCCCCWAGVFVRGGSTDGGHAVSERPGLVGRPQFGGWLGGFSLAVFAGGACVACSGTPCC